MAFTLKNYKITNFYSVFTDYQYIFDTSKGAKLFVTPSSEFNKKVKLYIPEALPLGSVGGIPIKGGGYIYGDELVDLSLRDHPVTISYSYKFFCNSYQYKCEYEGLSDPLPFHFRYERTAVIRPDHPEYHLQVIHDAPRYQAPQISFRGFVEIIAFTFFENKTRINSSPWLMR